MNMNKLADRCIFSLALLLVLAVAALFLQPSPASRAVDAPAVIPSEPVELPIVMYHHILKEQARLNTYTISPDEFLEDLRFLRDQGYTTISVQQLLASVNDGVPLPPKPVMITFDDGYESFHEYAYPLLQEFGFQAVFSVVGRYADQYTESQDHHVRYSHSDWEQLLEMQESGLVEIGNHTYNMHANEGGRHGAAKKPGETDEEYRLVFLEDVGRMQEVCLENLGQYPLAFTYPFGQISPEALPLIQELGFQVAFICQQKYNYLTGSAEELYHLNRFNRPHGSSLQSILAKAKQQERKSK